MSALIVDRSARFVGSLLGCAFGDVLGASVEMQTRSEILAKHGGLLRDFLATERGFGCYTDDTEMTLALTRSILRAGGVESADCGRAYVEAFSPRRGYGRSAALVLSALQQGADWRETGTMFFPDGSFGNGAAMRIAPIGLLYGQLPCGQLLEMVKAAIWMTHTHREAVEVALLQARSVGIFLAADGLLGSELFLQQMLDFAPESILNGKLQLLGALLRQQASAEAVVAAFGCGVRSAGSWPPALWAALRFNDDPEEAIVQAVNLGGDSDTIGAMTGALVGALHGKHWFPPRWFDNLENGVDGRDELIVAAEKLAEFPLSAAKICPD